MEPNSTQPGSTAMWTNDGDDLYVTDDRSEVVSADDPRAAFLLVAKGGQITIEEAQRYGLTGEQSSQAQPEAPEAPEADEKAKAATVNKAKANPTNKSK